MDEILGAELKGGKGDFGGCWGGTVKNPSLGFHTVRLLQYKWKSSFFTHTGGFKYQIRGCAASIFSNSKKAPVLISRAFCLVIFF